MVNWYKRLDRRYRALLHLCCLFFIIAIPTIYEDKVILPLPASIIWSIALFSELFLVLLGHKIKMDEGTSDNAALKRIQKLNPEELEKERKYLQSKLNSFVIVGPGIKLMDNEICLYKGEADTIYDPAFIKYYLGDLCPELERDTKGRCPGILYITNRRIIMEAAFYSFKLDYQEILAAQHTGKTLFLMQKYDVAEIVSKDMKGIIEVFNLLNQVSMAAEDPDRSDEATRYAI